MNVLKLQNIYSWLLSDDQDLKDLLWKAFRFRRKGYYHSPLFKQRRWDGFDAYVARDSGRFLTGLLPEVKLALERRRVSYRVVDERGGFSPEVTDVDDQFLNRWLKPGATPVTLHDYQVDYINQVASEPRGIVRSPTGSGKSLCIVGVLKTLPPNTPTLVMTRSTDLCHQLYEDIGSWGFERLGKCIGSRKKDFRPDIITVANVDSVHKIEALLPHVRALVVDEVHTMVSKVPKAVYKRMPRAYMRVGVSATPFKFGETDKSQKCEVKGFFGPVINYRGRALTTRELQEREVLSSSRCVFYPVGEPQLPYETYIDAVTLGIAESVPFNRTVARLAKKLKGRTLILVERIAQGEMLSQLIPGAHWIHGKDNADAREGVIRRLQDADHFVGIVQQQLISAGINLFIHNLINAMGGAATHQVIQRVGRGLRRAGDKESLNYYDWVFNINHYLANHSFHRIKVLRGEGHEVVLKEEVDF